jgi:hypothetical protein
VKAAPDKKFFSPPRRKDAKESHGKRKKNFMFLGALAPLRFSFDDLPFFLINFLRAFAPLRFSF